jgi:hypothetical protein
MAFTNSQQKEDRARCQCCGYSTIEAGADYEICPVCFWEDDGRGDEDTNEASGPNHDMSLAQARQNFREFGACDRRFLQQVRKPKPEEL